jgi:hypothetical protein
MTHRSVRSPANVRVSVEQAEIVALNKEVAGLKFKRFADPLYAATPVGSGAFQGMR